MDLKLLFAELWLTPQTHLEIWMPWLFGFLGSRHLGISFFYILTNTKGFWHYMLAPPNKRNITTKMHLKQTEEEKCWYR